MLQRTVWLVFLLLIFSAGFAADGYIAKNNGLPENCAATLSPLVGNPIHAGTGNKFQTETDLSAGAANGIRFVRYYNSFDDRSGVLGTAWRHTYQRRIAVAADRSRAEVIRADGKTYTFTPSGGDWVSDPDVTATLTESASGWTWHLTSGTVEQYDLQGRLRSIRDAQGRSQMLDYDAAGNLVTVTDSYGRILAFSYDAQNRISRIASPDGDLEFAYDSNDNLAQVTYPDTTTRQYLYENSAFPHALTGIIDENGSRYATWSYDGEGRATSSEHAGGADRVTLVYNADGTTTVTEASGQVRTFHFTIEHGVMKVSRIEGGPCASCGGTTQNATYDANGFLASRTDFNGVVTTYVNNGRGLPIRRTEAAGTPEERTITTEWHPDYSLPTKITEPGKVTDFEYDASGNLLRRTETDPASGASRTWRWTYNNLGQILRQDGPRTDVDDITTSAYDAQGNLVSVTNALGHVTRITGHDASGRPLRLVDPNGLETLLEYDARGRIRRRDVGGEVTRFTYDGAGNITRLDLPDGRYLEYDYDAARRLIGVRDQLGNRIRYTLDAAGNRIEETVYDSSSILVRTRRQVYDELNRLIESIGAAGQTTAYAYDANGNRTRITDAKGNPAVSAFDALNRLTTVTDALGGVVGYRYDAQHNLTAVTDPNGNTTRYEYDGLGNRLRQISPDTGTTTYTHDAAGNVLSQTDANGQTTTFRYDALNRVVQADYADGARFVYAYDTAPNGRGRLASVTGPDTAVAWEYDPRGRITVLRQTYQGRTFTTRYGYDTGGRRVALTYPSGLQVAYRYGNGQLTQLDLSGQPFITDIRYDAFGDVSQWTWAATGLIHRRQYDLDGRLTAIRLGADTRTLDYDPVGNLTALQDSAIHPIFDYDALQRLVAANDADWQRTYAYDPNGNRTALTTEATALAYAYDPAGNRLLDIGPTPAQAYQYDANGNTLHDGRHSYQYDARNRLRSVEDTVDYAYNALGQRIARTLAGRLTHFLYDPDGRLIAEADATGRPTREYVWFNGRPVAYRVTPPRNPALYRFEGTDNKSGEPVIVDIDRAAGILTFQQPALLAGQPITVDPRHWKTRKESRIRFNYKDKTTGLHLKGKIDGDTAPYTARLEIEPHPVKTRYRLNPTAEAGVYTATAKTGETATLTLDETRHTVTLQRAGRADRVLPVEAEHWKSNKHHLEIEVETADLELELKIEAGKEDPHTGKLELSEGPKLKLKARLTSGDSPLELPPVVYAVHADHLGTPRLLTEIEDASQTPLWRWDGTPFGATAANEDPDGDGTSLTFNLRFPGQYYDGETGLHYNYFRYYDPQTGRYVTSDPIGLAGGSNSYVYVFNNPFIFIDYLGLYLECSYWGGVCGDKPDSNISIGVSGTVGSTSVSISTNNSNIEWSQTTALAVGMSVDVCVNLPNENVTNNSCRVIEKDNSNLPDFYSVGLNKHNGLTINSDGTVCVNIGVAYGFPVGVGWNVPGKGN